MRLLNGDDEISILLFTVKDQEHARIFIRVSDKRAATHSMCATVKFKIMPITDKVVAGIMIRIPFKAK